MTKQELSDPSKGKYFSQILHMADDDLGPYAMRLLVHYTRVAGRQGKCWEGIRATATITQMSVGMVTQTRNELVKTGYIRVKHRKDDTCVIVIVDRWAENIARYSTQDTSEEDEFDAPSMTRKRSPHEHPVIPGEHPVHHMNTSELEGVHHMNERIQRTKEEEPKKKKTTYAPRGANDISLLGNPDDLLIDAQEVSLLPEGKKQGTARNKNAERRLTQTPATTAPIPQVAPRPLSPAVLLGEAFGVPPVGKRAYGKYGEVAKNLIDATICSEEFGQYIGWSKRESKNTGDWEVTVTALMNPDRMSKYVAARNAHKARTSVSVGYQVGIALNPSKNAYNPQLDPAYTQREEHAK